MATPTRAEIEAQVKRIVALLHLVRDRAEITATTLATQIDSVQQAVEGDYAAEELDAVEAFRSKYAALMESGAVQSLLLPELRHYARLQAWPETDGAAILGRVYEYMHANSLTVNSRGITFGSVTAGGSNVGTGTVYRLTVDENAYPIEATTAEVKTFECLFDRQTRTEAGEEEFEVRGQAASKDGLETLGSGFLGSLRAVSARDSAALVNNPSFSTYTGTTAVPTDITSWTVTTNLTNFEIDTTNYYRLVPGETTGAALKIKAQDGLTQKFSVKGSKLAAGVPYMMLLRYNREVGSFAGTLRISLGTNTASVVLAAQTGWGTLALTLDKNLWYKNWKANDASVKVEVTAYTSGTLLVDDLILVPMAQVDGCYYAIVGSSTPFLRADTFTFTDTIAAEAKIQYWMWRSFGRYLPSNDAGGETWTDPT